MLHGKAAHTRGRNSYRTSSLQILVDLKKKKYGLNSPSTYTQKTRTLYCSSLPVFYRFEETMKKKQSL